MARIPHLWPLLLTILAAFLFAACSDEPLVTPALRRPRTPQAEALPTLDRGGTPQAPLGLPPGYRTPVRWVDGELRLPEVDPTAFRGTVVTAGSSTVFPLTERLAERFQEEGFPGRITVDSIGSGAGFERFCKAGETDIANASREIRPSEVESCRRIGRTPIEFRVGTDALAVVVSRENEFVDSLTLEELAQIFSTAATWAEVRGGWPARPILRFSPGTDSGTFDFFVEHVFHKDEAPLLSADNLNLSEDDNVLVRGVEGSPYAIGYLGFAYYLENADRLRAVPIQGVAPNQESAEAGTYPLARPLLLYSDETVLRTRPQVAAFIAFYLNRVNEEILDVGYFPASPEALELSRRRWLTAMDIPLP